MALTSVITVDIGWWEYNVSFLVVTDRGNRVKLGGERNKELEPSIGVEVNSQEWDSLF